MKKRLLSIITVSVLGVVVANGGMIQWTSGNLGADVQVGADLANGMLVALYHDVNEDNSGNWYDTLRLDNAGSVTLASSASTQDDVFLGFTTTLFQPVATLTLLTTQPDIDVQPNGANVYSVIFDAGTMAASKFFVVADATPFDVGSGGYGTPVEPTVAYTLGTNIEGSWQAIPEPAVASFICIFGAGFLVSRRIFGRAH